MNKYEQEFQETANQINNKLKEAAAALKEANRLASEAGLPGLIYTQWTSDDDSSAEEMTDEEVEALEADEDWDGEASPLKIKMDLIDVSNIENAIEDGGWSTSSSYC
jgi:hypothetical protein